MNSFSQPKYKIELVNNKEKNNNTINVLSENDKKEIQTQNAICNIIDVINDNNLNIYYQDNSSNFKHNIDQLNLKFYLETEKILSQNNNLDIKESQNKLFLILFKQINLYIKEIERLNIIILENNHKPEYIQKKMSILSRKKDNFEEKELIIQTLKNSNKSLEKKLSYFLVNENNFRKENEELKKELNYYKNIYQNTINAGSPNIKMVTNSNSMINSFSDLKIKKRTFSENNQNNMNKKEQNKTLIANRSINKKENENEKDVSPFNYKNSKLKIIKTIKKKLNINNIYNVKKHIDEYNDFKNSKKHNNGLKLNSSSGNFHYFKNSENNKIDFLFNNMKLQLKDKKKLIENKSTNKVHNKNKTSPLFIGMKYKEDKEKIINGGV